MEPTAIALLLARIGRDLETLFALILVWGSRLQRPGWARVSALKAMLATGAFVVAASAGSAQAAPGDLDPTFGGDGKITTAFFTEADASATVYAIAVQPDGKIVAAGAASLPQQNAGTNNSEFALARYNTNGSLDTSFSGDGKVTQDIAGGHDYAYGVAVQADGKIIAVGSANLNGASFYTRFTLVRYNSDGSLDTGFGTTGVVSTDFFGTDNVATSVALQADGRIVVAGSAHDGIGNRFALARYDANGSLDPSFGTGGKVTTSFFGFDDAANAVALDADGKIVAVGSAYPGGANNQFAVARYNSDGTLDASFGAGGKVTTDFFGRNDLGQAVILQSDRKIVAAGLAYPIGSGIDEYALARYTADGNLDSSFSGDGKATATFSSAERRLAAAGQVDGKIVAVSWGVDSATGFDVFSLARFNTDGSLDPSFGASGRVTTNFLGSQNQAYAIAVQTDGKIVAAGSAFNLNGTYSVFALARYDAGAGTAPAVTVSALTLNPSSVVGGTSSTGTVTLTAAAPTDGLLVTLTEDSPATTVPASVTVPAGVISATFTVTTTSVATSTAATVSAAFAGVTRTATLTVSPAISPTLSTLSLSPTSVTGGSASTGTVTLTGAAPSGGTVVSLSDDSAATAVPASVTVPAGATSTNFTVTTTSVTASTTATVSAVLAGVTRTATLTVNPATSSTPSAPTLLSPAANATPAQPVTFDWSDVATATSYEIQIDDSSTIVAPFTANQIVSVSQVTIGGLPAQRLWWRVRARNAAGVFGPFSSTRRFTPQAATAAASLSAVSVNPTSVVGPTAATGTATLTAAAPSGGAVVTLASSNPTVASVPASVTVAAGATSASFTVSTSAVGANTSVTLTGTYSGTSRTSTLTVTPPPPDASLNSLTLNPTSVTGGGTSQGSVTLTSAAPSGGAVVALSSNATAATVPASVTVAAGATSATFTVATTSVPTSTAATISAVLAGVIRTATLTVNPPSTNVTLTVTASGRSGERVTSSPTGINVAVGSTQSAGFASNSSIILSATNSRDVIWSGACSSGGNKARTCTFTISGNVSVNVNVQ